MPFPLSLTGDRCTNHGASRIWGSPKGKERERKKKFSQVEDGAEGQIRRDARNGNCRKQRWRQEVCQENEIKGGGKRKSMNGNWGKDRDWENWNWKIVVNGERGVRRGHFTVSAVCSSWRVRGPTAWTLKPRSRSRTSFPRMSALFRPPLFGLFSLIFLLLPLFIFLLEALIPPRLAMI